VTYSSLVIDEQDAMGILEGKINEVEMLSFFH